MGYSIEGRLLEACSCKAPCPCWVGDDPDGGKCDALVAYHDDRATAEQKEMILGAHTGRFGGPMGDLAPLIGEVLGVYDVKIAFNIREGKGTIAVGDVSNAEMAPYTDAQGRPTKLVDTVFSTIPGSPAYVGRAQSFRMNIPEHGFGWEFD